LDETWPTRGPIIVVVQEVHRNQKSLFVSESDSDGQILKKIGMKVVSGPRMCLKLFDLKIFVWFRFDVGFKFHSMR
jgi:hypothetical protein